MINKAMLRLSTVKIIITEGLVLLLIAPWACLAKVAPQCAPGAVPLFSLLRPAEVAIGWEGWHPRTSFGSCIYIANVGFYLDCLHVKEWLGKAHGEYGERGG